jgi:hypothetical protein
MPVHLMPQSPQLLMSLYVATQAPEQHFSVESPHWPQPIPLPVEADDEVVVLLPEDEEVVVVVAAPDEEVAAVPVVLDVVVALVVPDEVCTPAPLEACALLAPVPAVLAAPPEPAPGLDPQPAAHARPSAAPSEAKTRPPPLVLMRGLSPGRRRARKAAATGTGCPAPCARRSGPPRSRA